MVVSLSIVPVGSGVGIKEPVAAVLRVIDRSGLPYRLTAMATEIEGEWDEVMTVVKAAHDAGRRATGRVLTSITIDDREGAEDRLQGKVRDVEELLGKALDS
jgi:uncharacterized protein (TIGR00106 family)